MDRELVQGQEPWRNLENTEVKTVALSSSSLAELFSSRHTPSSELFLPEKRQKLLQHLIESQFPAIRELVSNTLESNFFLLDAAQTTLQAIGKVVLNADEYHEQNPYWDWVRSVVSLTVHEIVMEKEKDKEKEASPLSQEELRSERMRKHFNCLPLEQRRALYFIAVMGHTIEDAAQALGEELEQVRNYTREGLRRVLQGIESEEKVGNA